MRAIELAVGPERHRGVDLEDGAERVGVGAIGVELDVPELHRADAPLARSEVLLREPWIGRELLPSAVGDLEAVILGGALSDVAR